jgi:methylated-DNA-protein-cysteine methyltransferase-like protein
MAGYPGAARLVAKVLRRGFGLPWQRVLGAGGQIKLTGDSALEQRFRLEAEGVRFRGRKVDMKQCEFKARTARRQNPQRAK